MGFGARVVNTLVVLFALFFCAIGFSFLFFPLVGSSGPLEGGPAVEKSALGVIFLLAAAPMFYYVFSKNAKGLPPPRKTRKGPTPPASPP